MKLSMSCFSLLLCCGFLLNAEEKKVKKMSDTKGAPAKIAIIDVRRIISQDPEVLKTGSDEWRELFNKMQEVLEPSMKEFAELEASYKKKIAEAETFQKQKSAEIESLQKGGFATKEKIQDLIADAQRTMQKKYQEELLPLENRLQAQHQQLQRFSNDELYKAQAVVGPKVEKAIDAVCEAQGWDFAISKDALPTRKVAKRFEITDDVLTIVNNEYAAQKALKNAQVKKS
jgi:Skp family chaperone for outer membrane proteins